MVLGRRVANTSFESKLICFVLPDLNVTSPCCWSATWTHFLTSLLWNAVWVACKSDFVSSIIIDLAIHNWYPFSTLSSSSMVLCVVSINCKVLNNGYSWAMKKNTAWQWKNCGNNNDLHKFVSSCYKSLCGVVFLSHDVHLLRGDCWAFPVHVICICRICAWR